MTDNLQFEKITTTSANITQDRLDQLRQLIPEAFSEGKIDFEKLRAVLGDHIDDRPERYSFTWAGKRGAIRLLQTPTSATLVPARDESINFDDTSHIFIEGENLEVLKLLYKAYFGKVKMIYIDPPYNTGKDFVYPDNYADPLEPYLQLTDQKDASGNLLTSNPDSSGRFHSNWLNMMYPRLFVARQLLREVGAIFVSIDDHECHNLRTIMNEIFGEEQFIADISVVNNLKGRSDRQNIATAHEHLLMYTKNSFESYGLPLDEDKLAEYNQTDENGRRFQWRDLRKRGGADTREERPNLFFPLFLNQKTDTLSLNRQDESDIQIYPLKSDHSEGCWRWGKKRVASHLSSLKASYVENSDRWNVYYRVYLEIDGERRTSKPKSVWIGSQYSTDLAQRAFKKILPDARIDFTPKAVGLLKEIIHQSAKDDNICLDFFAGSCTLAQALFELNDEDGGRRKFIAIQLPEPIDSAKFPTIAEVGKERTRRVISKFNETREGKLPVYPDGDLGFRVFKLAPSHFKPWQGSPESDATTYNQQLDLFRDPLKEGWQPEAVIWEVTLKEGYPLTSRITQANFAGHVVYRVANPDDEQQFHICLEREITADLPRQLGLDADDLFVCRGSGFG